VTHGTKVRIARLTTERGVTFESLRDLHERQVTCTVDGINEVSDGFRFAFLRVKEFDNWRPDVPVELLEPVR
jgi:hypothetical protein